MSKGEEYTDPWKLNEAIYEISFIGCSGRVKFDKSLHVRKDIVYQVKQLQKINDKETMVHVAKFCAGCAVI